jgi:hypothetical protein
MTNITSTRPAVEVSFNWKENKCIDRMYLQVTLGLLDMIQFQVFSRLNFIAVEFISTMVYPLVFTMASCLPHHMGGISIGILKTFIHTRKYTNISFRLVKNFL